MYGNCSNTINATSKVPRFERDYRCVLEGLQEISGIIEYLYDLNLGKSVDTLKPFFIHTIEFLELEWVLEII